MNAETRAMGDWDPVAIARDARRSAPVTSFAQGERVAWSVRGYAGLMDGVSEIHVVYDDATTYCEESLPQYPAAFLPPLRSLEPCATCAERYASRWEPPAPEEPHAPVIPVRSVA